MEQYSNLSYVYDQLNADYDYDCLADFLVSCIKENERVNTSLVLDLACGTGKLTFKLRERGYDMTGIDLSEGMLSQAHEYATKNNINDVLFLCQNMSSFELYGTVDACVCTLDSINCLWLVHNYLIPEGVFVFDINTPYRFKEVYGNNDYILENEDSLCAWQNEYDDKTKICSFYLSIFRENEQGLYERFDEVQREKCYSKTQIERALLECGFEIIAVYGDTDKKEATDTDEKWYFVARCKK